MSFPPNQTVTSQGALGIEAYTNGRVNGSAALRSRSPHSERLKQPSERLPDQMAYIDKQPVDQIRDRSSEDTMPPFSETDQIQRNGDVTETDRQFQTAEGIHSFGTQSTWSMRLNVFWIRNKGVLMVLLAELFSAFMITATRLLETEGGDSDAGMQPFQVCLTHETPRGQC